MKRNLLSQKAFEEYKRQGYFKQGPLKAEFSFGGRKLKQSILVGVLKNGQRVMCFVREEQGK